jgi:hypothetical protein
MGRLVYYKKPPKGLEWAVEYVVIEYWSIAQDQSDFKCVVCTTHSKELAEEIVKEDEMHRTWVKAWRLFPK